MIKVRQFIYFFFVLIILFIGFTVILYLFKPNLSLVKKSLNKDFLIYNYQVKKIDIESNIKFVFIGDSSLGNGFDANHFEKYTNNRTLNLALSDIYGLSGQYNLLKKVVNKNRNSLKKIFIVTSIYFPLNDFEDEAFFITSNNLSDFFMSTSKLKFIKYIYEYSIKSLTADYFFDEKKYNNFFKKSIYKDYIKQSINKNLKSKAIPDNIDYRKKIFYLKKIIELCKKNNIELIKLYGPHYVDMPNNLNQYMETNNKIFEQLKIHKFKNIKDLVKFGKEQLGDKLTHVSPKYKIDITQKYIYLLNKKGLL